MDLLIGLVSVLLLASATTFFWLSIVDSRQSAGDVAPSGPAVALNDLVGTRHPLFPRTIRQTPLS